MSEYDLKITDTVTKKVTYSKCKEMPDSQTRLAKILHRQLFLMDRDKALETVKEIQTEIDFIKWFNRG